MDNTFKNWVQEIANALGETTTNGDWWQTIAGHFGLTAVNGNYQQALCDYFDANVDMGESFIQALAEDFGATGTVNGSWIQAFADEIEATMDLVDTMKTRIATDNGTFEAQNCMIQTLNNLEI